MDWNDALAQVHQQKLHTAAKRYNREAREREGNLIGKWGSFILAIIVLVAVGVGVWLTQSGA